jgi:hypothetical protein
MSESSLGWPLTYITNCRDNFVKVDLEDGNVPVVFMFITGKSGSGKTYYSTKLAEEVHSTTGWNTNIVRTDHFSRNFTILEDGVEKFGWETDEVSLIHTVASAVKKSREPQVVLIEGTSDNWTSVIHNLIETMEEMQVREGLALSVLPVCVYLRPTYRSFISAMERKSKGETPFSDHFRRLGKLTLKEFNESFDSDLQLANRWQTKHGSYLVHEVPNLLKRGTLLNDGGWADSTLNHFGSGEKFDEYHFVLHDVIQFFNAEEGVARCYQLVYGKTQEPELLSIWFSHVKKAIDEQDLNFLLSFDLVEIELADVYMENRAKSIDIGFKASNYDNLIRNMSMLFGSYLAANHISLRDLT